MAGVSAGKKRIGAKARKVARPREKSPLETGCQGEILSAKKAFQSRKSRRKKVKTETRWQD